MGGFGCSPTKRCLSPLRPSPLPCPLRSPPPQRLLLLPTRTHTTEGPGRGRGGLGLGEAPTSAPSALPRSFPGPLEH